MWIYRSPVFTARLRWARSVSPMDGIRILSAKHGLVELEQMLRPYDVEFAGTETIEVERGLLEVLLLAPARGVYASVLRNSGVTVHCPFKGGTVPFGVQMQILKWRSGQPWPWRDLNERETKYVNPGPGVR